MIEIGQSGLCFDGGNKGNLEIYTKQGKIFEKNAHYEGINVDCTGEIFKFLLNHAQFKTGVNGKRFLKNHEYLIKEAFKHQKDTHRSICECYNCGADLKGNPHIVIDDDGYEHECCPPMGVSSDWGLRSIDYQIKFLRADDYIFAINNPITPIKDFDLRSEYVYGLHFVCKIKSIKNPNVKNNSYYQKGVFYEDNTSKTVKFELQDSVAEFDKWNVGDKIEAFGIYQNGIFAVTEMKLIKEVPEEPTVTTNRNSETPGYSEWRNSIISRDKECVCCGQDTHLEAHHLFGYKENPTLAIDENNGVTLCKFCHDKYHNIYGVKNINPVDFMNFIKRFGVR